MNSTGAHRLIVQTYHQTVKYCEFSRELAAQEWRADGENPPDRRGRGGGRANPDKMARREARFWHPLGAIPLGRKE